MSEPFLIVASTSLDPTQLVPPLPTITGLSGSINDDACLWRLAETSFQQFKSAPVALVGVSHRSVPSGPASRRFKTAWRGASLHHGVQGASIKHAVRQSCCPGY